MLLLAMGTVVRVIDEDSTTQTLEVKMMESEKAEQALHYFAGHVKCSPGDLVLLNTTGLRLQLGTGGYHIIVGKLDDEEKDYFPSKWGHIMKMRYAPMQLAVDTVEEQKSPHHALFKDLSASLAGTPVIIGELHSLLPTIALTIKQLCRGIRLVYVMPDGASLPLGLSSHVRCLKQLELLNVTITTGHAWGGDLEAVNIYSGLLAAKHIAAADIIVSILGPGVVGTGTAIGHSAMQLAEVIHAVSLLDGIPIFVPRISFSDKRERHFGMSHHTRTLLRSFVLRPVCLPIPLFGDERDSIIQTQEDEDQLKAQHQRVLLSAPDTTAMERLHSVYPEVVTTMGRSLSLDASPFQTAFLCAKAAVYTREWMIKNDGVRSPGCGDPATLAELSSYLKVCEG